MKKNGKNLTTIKGVNMQKPAKVLEKQLINAVENLNVEAVKKLLDEGAPINAKVEHYGEESHLFGDLYRDYWHNYRFSDKQKEVQLMKKILDLFFASNQKIEGEFKGKGDNLLCFMIEHNYLLDCGKLLRLKPEINTQNIYENPLMIAVRYRKNKAVELLLKHGADVNLAANAGTPIEYAITYNLEVLPLLLENGGNVDEAFVEACRKGDEGLIKELLSKGAKIDSTNRLNQNALFFQKAYTNKNIFNMLLESGVDINHKDKNGFTPIFRVIYNKDTDYLEIFLEKGADIEAKNNADITPVHYAYNRGFQKEANLLVRFGANVNNQDIDGITPLMQSIIEGKQNAFKALLKAGADISLKDKDGDDVYSLIKSQIDKKSQKAWEELIATTKPVKIKKPTPKSTKVSTPKVAKLKYFPTTKKELLKLVEDSKVKLETIDTSKIKDMSYIFKESKRRSFKGLETWNVESVENMKDMFRGAKFFNHDISAWNTKSLKNMQGIFYECENFNQPLDKWDVSKVTNMAWAFYRCIKFNQPLDSWDVSSVTSMDHTFNRCIEFNQPLNSWNVSKVETMCAMFMDARRFNQPLDLWNTSKVKEMGHMFSGAFFFNQNIESWDTSNVESMSSMFSEAVSFNQPLNNWNVSKVIYMQCMFYGGFCGEGGKMSFNQPLDKWDVRNVKDMDRIFSNCHKFSQNIDNWQVRKDCRFSYEFTDLQGEFAGSSLTKLPKWYAQIIEEQKAQKKQG